MKLQTDSQAITINILPNISRGKDNQTMKFGQLIEYNMRTIFLQTSCRKWGKNTSSRPLFVYYKNFIWSKSKSSEPKCQYSLIVLDLDMQLKQTIWKFRLPVLKTL